LTNPPCAGYFYLIVPVAVSRLSGFPDPKKAPDVSAPLSRRKFLKAGSLALLGPALPGLCCTSPTFDLVIKGALVLDGTGAPARRTDLGIAGDSIAALGEIDPSRARRVIQAEGLHAAPGFIDIHTHSDGVILTYPEAESRVFQGVTTEVTGNCGGSATPLGGPEADKRRSALSRDLGTPVDWTDTASYFAKLEAEGISVNHALLLGHGTLRENASGTVSRPLTPEELAAMLRALEEGLDQGAAGLSTGLEYVPGNYAHPEEILALARVLARRDALYATHIRNEAAGLLEAIGEALDLGRASGVRVEISHLKAAGKPNWGKQSGGLALIEKARSEGVRVQADAYPYDAYSTGLTIYLPAAAQEGGPEALLARLRDPAGRSKLREEAARIVADDPGGFGLIEVSRVSTEANQPIVGRNIEQIAALRGVEPAEALISLIEEEETRVECVAFGMSAQNVELVLAHPLVMVGSDGQSMAPRGPAGQSRPHPRSYGTFPRVLGLYCRERELFSLPEAVRKMTSQPAEMIGLKDRGRIGRRMKADLVLFDAARVRDTSTFSDPHRYPEGIRYVLVNGVTVVEEGRHTGRRPGRVLRRG
jgi:N-acyl-D-amino-acid deacylase